MRLPVSQVREFFESKPFAEWKKSREAEFKQRNGVLERLNEVIRGLSMVGKTVARTGR